MPSTFTFRTYDGAADNMATLSVDITWNGLATQRAIVTRTG